MKKMLSLALTLTLCLGLTIPALAAGKPGDTAVTDSIGNTYTLSNPIMYTTSRAQVEAIDRSSMSMVISGFDGDEKWEGAESDLLDKHFWSRMTTVYAVPENTVVTLPANVTTCALCELDVTWEGNTGHAPSYKYLNYPGEQTLTLGGTGYILGVEIWDENSVENPTANSGTHDIITAPEGDSYVYGDSIIYFYVPEDASAPNPFGSPTSTTPSTPTNPTTPSKTSFTDVAASAYYADSVAWAVEQKITAGTSATTFSPDETCTTAQILTFLWRAKGSPEPTSKTNPFIDVKESDYYYKAALWAKENNVVSKDSTTFNGNTPCTRSMAVLYIWRSAGFPAAEKNSSFTDVAATTLYAPAVDWAVEKGVTSGTSGTTFSPETTCTRGQIVTFLYRAFSK